MKIALITMPFAPPEGPAIGLTQIAAVLRETFGARVEVRLLYLNLDVAACLRESGFYRLAISPHARLSGLADWFFRAAAFREATDNLDAYLGRYYFFDATPEAETVRSFVRTQRTRVYALMDTLIDRYALAHADVVGFSLCFFQTVASLAMARRLKARNPNVTIVLGGPLVRGVPGKTLVDCVPAIDYVVSGPGLINFPALIGHALAGETAAIPHLQGVFAKGVASGRPTASNEGPARAIDQTPPLDYTGFLDHYAACLGPDVAPPFLLMQTSRGCWWADRQRCTFCGLNSHAEQFEAMSPASALRHIRGVLGYAGRVRHVVACDNITPPTYFKEVFPYLEPPPGVAIKYETRVTLTVAELKVLRDAGVACIQPGVEALATESLRLMCKGVDAFDNILFLKRCRALGLFAEWNLLLFSPGEREAVYRKYEQDLPRLMHLAPPTGVFPVEYVRGSRYVAQPEAFGLALAPHESLAYIYPFERETLFRLSDRFIDETADQGRMALWLDRLGRLVAAWRERWFAVPARRPHLILTRDNHGPYLYDSRFEGEAIYRIADASDALLRTVASVPLTLGEAAQRCGLANDVAVRERLFLVERALLFEEDGRMMSLALEVDGKPV